MYKKVTHIITSHYSEHLELEISDKQLKFCSIPWYSLFNVFVVEIQSVFGKIHLNKTMKRSDKYLNLSSLRQGNYFFNLTITNTGLMSSFSLSSLRMAILRGSSVASNKSNNQSPGLNV